MLNKFIRVCLKSSSENEYRSKDERRGLETRWTGINECLRGYAKHNKGKANYMQAKPAVHAFRNLGSTTTRPQPNRSYLASNPVKFSLHRPLTQPLRNFPTPKGLAGDFETSFWGFAGSSVAALVAYWAGILVQNLFIFARKAWLLRQGGTYQIVPYTKRRHLVIDWLAPELETAKKEFEEEQRGSKFLPVTHPVCVRVNEIGRKIIGALKRDLNLDKHQCHTSHLVDMDWEFLVLDDPRYTAYVTWRIGKVVVFTGALKHHASDDQLACVIGHEVAHVVARHMLEWVNILHLYLVQHIRAGGPFSWLVTRLLKWSPYNLWTEAEADHIGILLAASAGFNPKALRTWLEKANNKIEGGKDETVEHRIAILNRANINEKALAIYRDRISKTSESIYIEGEDQHNDGVRSRTPAA